MKSVICMSYCKPGLGDPLTPLRKGPPLGGDLQRFRLPGHPRVRTRHPVTPRLGLSLWPAMYLSQAGMNGDWGNETSVKLLTIVKLQLTRRTRFFVCTAANCYLCLINSHRDHPNMGYSVPGKCNRRPDGHGLNTISQTREITQPTTIRTCHKELSNRDQDRQEDFVPSLFVVTRKMLPLYHSADRLCSDTEVTQHTCFSGQPSGSATPGRVQLQGPVHETDTAAGATPQSTKPWVCCYQNGRLSNM
jgi:hypothetical protein